MVLLELLFFPPQLDLELLHRLFGEGHEIVGFGLDELNIPRLSRYLATVRRAISIFCSPRSSTIFWSESGRRASSFVIKSLIFFFTLSLATSAAPPPLEIPLLKKYLSSKIPTGV